MHPLLRQQYNAAYTPERYAAFMETINTTFHEAPTFRLGETPVFIPRSLKAQLLQAVDDITAVLVQPDFAARSAAAIPPHLNVPAEDAHPTFLQLDFGICRDAAGNISPQLIELQGFPSLYYFQHLLAEAYQQHFDIPEGWHYLFGGLTPDSYLALLRDVIVGDEDPRSVILLEIEPEKQNTRIDFWASERYLGLKVLCLSKVRREGRSLYYLDEGGQRVPIRRIYNRIIFDELEKRADLPREWNLLDPVDVEWVGHPNWFFRISKHTLPYLKSPFVPETHFLSDLRTIPDDLENWVLKPLFSFSGMGVKVNVTRADVEAVTDLENYILQRKVQYIPGIQTLDPDDPAKFEIRMMLLWDKHWPAPRLVNNLIRLSKGEMVGVRYNKGKDWVGASVGFFEP
jgi:hypothetical protein